MVALQVILLALRGVWANRLRSALTVLGIIAGVGCVVTLVAYSGGARYEMLKQFDIWGATRMGVFLQNWMEGFPATEKLTLEDARAIEDQCWTIANVAATSQLRFNARRGTVKQDRVMTTAAEPVYFTVTNKKFAAGGPYTPLQNENADMVCVLGATIKYDLFYDADALNQEIILDGKRFTVVGVLEEQGGVRWMNEDSMIIIPLNTAWSRLNIPSDFIEIVMQAIDVDHMDYAKLQVRELLRMRHPRIPLSQPPADILDEDEKEEYDPIQVWTLAEWRERREQTADSMARFLIVMGALALLIGAVGVMNVMLVSVEERTREIGLRKALGANRQMVLGQFMLEAFLVCVIGGALGTLVAVVACRWMAQLPDELQVPDPLLTPSVIAMAVGVTLAIGLFSGVYPAARAAAVDPISAMRFE